jgi:hypothetical protein
MRLVLDTNVYDKLASDQDCLKLLERACRTGAVEILRTHIQEDQLEAIKDRAKRDRMLGTMTAVPATRVPTDGSVLGQSKLGECRLGDGSADIKLDDIRGHGKPKHYADALLVTTAAAIADVFVTEEKGRLPRRIRATRSKLKVWDFQELGAYLQSIGLITGASPTGR